MRTESLRKISKGRRVQEGRKWPANFDCFAARAGAQRIDQSALGWIELLFGQNRQAWRGAFGDHRMSIRKMSAGQSIGASATPLPLATRLLTTSAVKNAGSLVGAFAELAVQGFEFVVTEVFQRRVFILGALLGENDLGQFQVQS